MSPGIGVALAAAGIDMYVQVDQTRRDIKTFHIDGFERGAGRDVRSHLGDLAILDGHVHLGIDVVLVVENMPVVQQQIVKGSASWAKPLALANIASAKKQPENLPPTTIRIMNLSGSKKSSACSVYQARLAVQLALPYSPISTVPAIVSPCTVPRKVQVRVSPLTAIKPRSSISAP